MSNISQLWYSTNEPNWLLVLQKYWDHIKPSHLVLEKRLNELNREEIDTLHTVDWYNFLHDSYFKWKYTAPNRYATTTMHLRKYLDNNQIDKLFNNSYWTPRKIDMVLWASR
ncbi:MAG: hypothetical protein K9J25_11305 [Bacteroidales bacterium]|nr:hypothetical protein [Bacteroidales bacterium]